MVAYLCGPVCGLIEVKKKLHKKHVTMVTDREHLCSIKTRHNGAKNQDTGFFANYNLLKIVFTMVLKRSELEKLIFTTKRTGKEHGMSVMNKKYLDSGKKFHIYNKLNN